MNDLKLYLWRDVLCDYTSGVMFALARTVEEARAKIVEVMPHVIDEELAQEPEVITEPFGFALWGGG